MPKLLLQPLDILVVDQLGKEFSGGGMDPYITGRAPTPYPRSRSHSHPGGRSGRDRPQPRKLLRRGHGRHYDSPPVQQNGFGIHLCQCLDLDGNAVGADRADHGLRPSGDPGGNEDLQCSRPEVEFAWLASPIPCMSREIYISECMLEEARKHPNIVVLGEPQPWLFDAAGNFSDIGVWHQHSM